MIDEEIEDLEGEDEEEHWFSGDTIAGRYRLQNELGRGAMGSVWRSTQLNLNREVALKLLLPEYVHRTGARARFEREARVASQLEHPNAVRIHDFGTAPDGQMFIAMEMLRGNALRAIVDTDRPVLGSERTLEILRPVADVLCAAHDIGLVHRDLKPENVFLERRGDVTRVVVVDFGLAFIEESEETGRLTADGIASGTPEYIPPEQAAGDNVGPPADVYSLGCMLYEMLTSRTPFSGSSMQLITQHLFSAAIPPSEVRRDLKIPRHLEDLCMRMLAKSPGERPSMEIVRGVLTQQVTGEGAVRERGRDDSYLAGREARMISTVRPAGAHATLTDLYAAPKGIDPSPLAIVGALEGDLAIGLGANGLLAYIHDGEEAFSEAKAIYAPRADLETLEALVATGVPVIADTHPIDMERITALLRIKVAEVVHRPVRAASLSKKVWRAIRRAKRRSS
ncbi:MAG: serine/threonine-protein kinase [Sandaracinaceae bacterium]